MSDESFSQLKMTQPDFVRRLLSSYRRVVEAWIQEHTLYKQALESRNAGSSHNVNAPSAEVNPRVENEASGSTEATDLRVQVAALLADIGDLKMKNAEECAVSLAICSYIAESIHKVALI